MRITVFIAFIAIGLFSFKSSNSEIGISFSNLKLETAMKLAKKEKKIIFIDAYTSWCRPCKIMAATAFKDEKVANTYNKQFVNLKIDMEKNADGAFIARKYKVQAYPTLLFIDSKGNLVKKAIGMQSASQLLNLAKSVEEN